MTHKLITPLIGLLCAAAALIAAPADADAIVRLGLDAEYVPISYDQLAYLDYDGHQASAPAGFGAALHLNLGVDVFSIGPKLNLRRRSYQDSAFDYTELDLNAMIRVQFPSTDLAMFAEGGAAMALNFGGVGYNAGLGLEYDITGAPLFDLHIGFAANYRDLPSERAVGADPKVATTTRGITGTVFIGVDFSL